MLLALEEESGKLTIRATPARRTRRTALLMFWGATLIAAFHQALELGGARLWPVQLGPTIFWIGAVGLDALFPRAESWLWLKRAEGLLEKRLG